MSSIHTPQEKKRLAYQHDRRNGYGQNAKASRKLIPLRKRKGERAYRKLTNQIVAGAVRSADLLADDSIENRVADVAKKRWRKIPDVSLADAIRRKQANSAARLGRKKKNPLPES
jgi:hypothetical protein